MSDKPIDELFGEAEESFTESEDQDIIKANKTAYVESERLLALMQSPGGEILIKQIKDDMSKSIGQLIDTREGRYLSDFESHLNLLTKLTNAKSQKEAISSWLRSLN